MVHESTVSKYLAADEHERGNALRSLVDAHAEFVTLDSGFVVVPESATIATAKTKMAQARACQDIFVTKSGNPEEPILGWVSNVRLAKFIET